jgi:hypothetical protein
MDGLGEAMQQPLLRCRQLLIVVLLLQQFIHKMPSKKQLAFSTPNLLTQMVQSELQLARQILDALMAILHCPLVHL